MLIYLVLHSNTAAGVIHRLCGHGRGRGVMSILIHKALFSKMVLKIKGGWFMDDPLVRISKEKNVVIQYTCLFRQDFKLLHSIAKLFGRSRFSFLTWKIYSFGLICKSGHSIHDMAIKINWIQFPWNSMESIYITPDSPDALTNSYYSHNGANLA